MPVGLFIPCFIDQLYPNVGISTLKLLEKYVTIHYPSDQTCCGQPMANAGFEHLSMGCTEKFLRTFSDHDYVVSPSGSCILHLKHQLEKHSDEGIFLSHRLFELVEFLVDIEKVKSTNAIFRHSVGLHQSCHGQRGLHLASMSERVEPQFSKPEYLLKSVEGLNLVTLDRVDECCGFGGTFCVDEEAVSVKMGYDRVCDHYKHNVEFITGTDMSCLMHLDGILKRKKINIKVAYIAEILNSEE